MRLRVPEHLVIALPMNVPVSLEQYDIQLTLKSVTLLHANHTPDGCTFLFLLKNGQIHWHTGDFRYLPSMVKSNPILSASANYALTTTGERWDPKLSVHTLYLDTTYCDPKYDLPTQTVAVDATIQYIERLLTENGGGKSSDPPGSIVYLFGTYTIGKEKVFRGVSKHFREKVIVLDSLKRNILKIVMDDYDEIIETNHSNIREHQHHFFVVGLGELSYDKILDSVLKINQLRKKHCRPDRGSRKITKVYGFKPTGWCHTSKTTSSSKKQRQQVLPWGSGAGAIAPEKALLNLPVRRRKVCDVDVTIVSVPYSEHSSFTELRDCVQTIGPKRILPTVGALSQRKNMVQMLLNKN
jgi:DNA cross-link repair 1A protein